MAAANGTSLVATVIAGADLTANQYGAVTPAGTIPAAGGVIRGIQQDGGGAAGTGPLTGQPLKVVTQGETKAMVNSSAILKGSLLTPAGTTGVLKLSAADTDYICAIADEANGSAAKIIAVTVTQMGRVASS